MWACPKCGEQVEDQFDACWSCGTHKDGTAPEELFREAMAEQNNGSADEAVVGSSPEEMLRQIWSTQRRQQVVLEDIQSKVGCLYVYLLVSLILGAIVAILSFIAR